MHTPPNPTRSSGGTSLGSSQTAAATGDVAKRLLELYNSRRAADAIRLLYSDDCRHVEPVESVHFPRVIEGKAALLEKNESFEKSNTIHSSRCTEPLVNGDQFTCGFSLDYTPTEGASAGTRTQMHETALYTVREGEIGEAKFFYTPTSL